MQYELKNAAGIALSDELAKHVRACAVEWLFHDAIPDTLPGFWKAGYRLVEARDLEIHAMLTASVISRETDSIWIQFEAKWPRHRQTIFDAIHVDVVSAEGFQGAYRLPSEAEGKVVDGVLAHLRAADELAQEDPMVATTVGLHISAIVDGLQDSLDDIERMAAGCRCHP